MPWCDNVTDRLVVAVASRAKVVDEMAAAIASKVENKGPASAWGGVTAALLTLGGFEARWEMNDVALVEELSDVQKVIATGLARRDGVVVGWGLPQSACVRRRWLGLAPPGPLEKRMTFEKKDWPLWKVWRTQRRLSMKDPLPAVVADRLDPDETLEALAEVDTNAYGIRTLLGGGVLPGDLIVRTAQKAGPRAAMWARAYADQILKLVETQSQPELGGVIGMRAVMECFLAILNNGGTIEPRWLQFVPLGPVEHARLVLEKLPAAQREAAVWERMSQPQLANPRNAFLLQLVVPLLDLVPSKRICDALLTRIRTANPPGAPATRKRIEAVCSKR
jgi:hypothetical protein